MKKEITLFIRGGAKVGSKRKITNGKTGKSVIGTVVKDLIDTMEPVETFNGKTMYPAKDYYRVELEE